MMTRDVENLIIKPIERMVELVDKISANPLGVKYEMLGEEDGFVQGMETTILLSTITKIGGLMKVGFGEAGANVIARNLQDSSNGKMNLFGGGELIMSIFGFCDVRNFTDTTECLQEEVMLFVNRIAHILHGIVAQCSGSANKNIGDAFLLTWKIDERATTAEITCLADQALFAFCKTLVELVRYEDFICNFTVAATQRLFKRFSDYHVRIGCGLHVGWAVEGAIGSNSKIDATYLSPHVGMTEFLESSTKEYGVSLLMSEPFFGLMSPAAQKNCRQVDRVRRTHEEEPVSLYTYDCDLTLDFADPNRKRPVTATDAAAGQVGRGLSNLRLAAMRVVNENRRGSVSAGPAPSVPSSRRGSVMPGAQGAHSAHSAHSAHGHGHGHGAHGGDTHSGENAAAGHGMHGPQLSMLNPRRVSLTTAAFAARAASNLQEASGDGSGQGKGSAGQLRNQFQTPVINVPVYDQSLWDTDIDVVDFRHKVNDNFRAIWAEGMKYYMKGGSDWQKARDKFQETMRLSKGKDGPTKFIISVLDKYQGSCPHDWAGYRDLEGGGGH
jgi:class 3 adenylate cyclase